MKSVNAESMVFYRSYMEAVKKAGLSAEERCEFYEGIVEYATTGEMPKFSNQLIEGFFVICKANIEANLRKYEQRQKAVENGKKGGAPKGNKNAAKKKSAAADDAPVQTEKANENNPKTTPKTTLNVNDTVTDTKNNTITISSFLKENKKKKVVKKKVDIQQRKEDFYYSVQPYISQYGEEAIREFYEYWAEPNLERTLMRFELQNSWHLERRIEAWMRKRISMQQYNYSYV